MNDTIKLSALDSHFADFILRIDRHPCDELWWGAALASYFAGRGHSCFHLLNVSDSAVLSLPASTRKIPLPRVGLPRWFSALQSCDTVGAPGEFTPLVLDSSGRLYLQRCWKYEQQISSGILKRSRSLTPDEARLDAALDRYFPAQADGVDMQRAAARMALTHRFSVISGGPGTGKTATVARILAVLLDVEGAAGENGGGPNIMLAAPTGKAAMRLHQSIRLAAGNLALPAVLKDRLPVEVSTIHRLLGVQSRRGGFRHNIDNRLPCDILVVDEASMVDLQLMAGLLEALRDDARLILLGDRNQLASVEAGAVLADICDSAGEATVAVTQLTRSYRFGSDSGIAALSRLINDGAAGAAAELLEAGQFPDISWRELPDGRAFEGVFAAAVRQGYARYVAATSPDEALAELGTFRVLSPLRSGMFGMENLNAICENTLGAKRKNEDQGGRPLPVMISGNNYELGLFNGDTGVVMESDGATAAWFESADDGLRRLSLSRMPPFETAFALTVHKSQGSEFDKVLLILPDRLSEVLCRELLYTAVTRARRHIEIWGTAEVFRQIVERRTIRSSGLRELLALGG
jgi:exodeoxyribonuclease V alpha subunit